MKLHALAAALTLASAGPALAASDYLLELDGVKGESKASIDIQSWSWGATNTSSVGSSGASGKLRESPTLLRTYRGGVRVAAGDVDGDGRADLAEISKFDTVSGFTFTVDASPPVVSALCATGKHIPKAVFNARGESFGLTDATVSKCVSLNGSRISTNVTVPRQTTRASGDMASTGLQTNPYYAITVTGSMKHTKSGHVTLLK